MQRPEIRSFSLVELLVVVAILVVLLALLSPALDKAVYQAELLQCGASHLRAIGTGALNYTLDYQRHYPLRPALQTEPILQGAWRTMNISHPAVADERPVIQGYIELETFVDPLTAKVDLERTRPESQVFACYSLWYGWKYLNGERTMRRAGDRFSYTDPATRQTTYFRALASDWYTTNNGNQWVQSSHADDGTGKMINVVYQDELLPTSQASYTVSYWTGSGAIGWGPMDRNIVYDDLAVVRYERAIYGDERMTGVGGTPASGTGLREQMPKAP